MNKHDVWVIFDEDDPSEDPVIVEGSREMANAEAARIASECDIFVRFVVARAEIVGRVTFAVEDVGP